MGWGDILKIAGKIGAGVAAPFTGGLSLAAIPAIDAIGAGAGAASDALTQNRSNQANAEILRLKMNQDQEGNYFDTLLKRDAAQNNNADSTFKKMLQTNYAASDPSQRVQTPGFSSFSKPISGVTPNQHATAQDPALQKALFDRASYQYDPLQGQLPARTVDTSALQDTAKSGFWEKLLGIGGAAGQAYASVRK